VQKDLGQEHLAHHSPCVVDLFSGAGGLSLGAARAGFVVRGAVEIDPDAIETHTRNFPQTRHVNSDVAQLTGRALLDALGMRQRDLAGIVGGPPCQGFSCIGKNDRRDHRSQLFRHFFRIVSEAQPRFFVAENVPGILVDRYDRFREVATGLVRKDYLLLPPLVLSAHEYGAPTLRKRVFFIGIRKDAMEPMSEADFLLPGKRETVRVRDALAGLPVRVSPDWQSEPESWRPVQVNGNGPFASRLHGHVPPGVGSASALTKLRERSLASGFLGTVHSKDVLKRYGTIEPGRRDKVSKSHRLDLDGFCPTLRAGTGRDHGRFQAVRPLHPTENRVITPREAARLQGFPDWFQFSPTKWHSFRQIGSSVSPIVAEHVLAVCMRAITGKSPQQEQTA
jgi:DNA (cytosine-5)-methyltransferase 1